MQDIRYWCEEGLIVADRSLVFSKSRERCWKKAEGERRSGGGEGGESLGVDWHGGKLSPTSGSEQPCLSILLSHDRKRHDRIGNTQLIWRCCVCLQNENSCFSLCSIYIYIFKYILWRCALCLSLLQPSCRFSLHSRVVFFVLYSSSLSRCLSVCLSLPVFLTVFRHTLHCCHIPSPSALSFYQQAALFWSLESGRTSLNTEGDKDISFCYCLYLNDRLENFFFALISNNWNQWREIFVLRWMPFIRIVWTKECIYIIMNRRLKHFTDSLRPVHSIKLGLWGIISFIHFFIYVSLCLVHVFMSRHKTAWSGLEKIMFWSIMSTQTRLEIVLKSPLNLQWCQAYTCSSISPVTPPQSPPPADTTVSQSGHEHVIWTWYERL